MGIQEIRITSKLTSEWDAVASQQLGWGRRLQASQSRKNQCVWSLDWEVRFNENIRSNLKHIRNMLRTNKNQKIELLGTKTTTCYFKASVFAPFFACHSAIPWPPGIAHQSSWHYHVAPLDVLPNTEPLPGFPKGWLYTTWKVDGATPISLGLSIMPPY